MQQSEVSGAISRTLAPLTRHFQNLRLGNKILVGFCIPLLMMFVIATALYFSTQTLVKTAADVQRTQEIISKGQLLGKLILVLGISKDLADQETGERGYLITGQEEFLDPFNAGRSNFTKHLEELQSIVAKSYDKSQVLNQIERLRKQVDSWHKEAANREIEARREINEGDATPLEFMQSVLSSNSGSSFLTHAQDDLQSIEVLLVNSGAAALIVAKINYSITAQELHLKNYLISGEDHYLEKYVSEQTEYEKRVAALPLSASKTLDESKLRQLMVSLSVFQTRVSNWRREAADPQILARQNFRGHGGSIIIQLQEVLKKATGKSILDDIRSILDDIKADFEKANDLEGINTIIRVAKYLVDQETGQRGFLITGDQTFLQPYIEGRANELIALAELRNIASNTYDIDEQIALREELNQTGASMSDVTALIENETGKAIVDELRRLLDAFIDNQQALIDTKSQESEAASSVTLYMIIFSAVFSILAALGAASLLSRTIVGAVQRLYTATQQVASGDFTVSIDAASKDEIGDLANSFNKMTHELRTTKVARDKTNSELEQQANELTLQKQQIEQKNKDLLDTQTELEQKADDLEMTGKYKSSFLATMSHEIRTPMAGIIGMADLLSQSQISPQQRDWITSIRSSSSNLLFILNEILDQSKLEAR